MKIFVVAGEASADLHASHLIRELKKHQPVQLIGIGGDHLLREGLNPIKTAREMGVVGLVEVIRRIPSTLRLLNELTHIAERERPDFALLLDLPDFNLRLAPKFKKLGIPVIYYISPQVWAWRSRRVHQMSQCIDLLLSILPFEQPWYKQHAPQELKVRYVGHPAIEEIPPVPYQPNPQQICLMPGSREGEFKSLFGDMLRAAAMLKQKRPGLRFVLPLASTLRNSPLVRAMLSQQSAYASLMQAVGLEIQELPAHQLLRESKLAIVASGTATLETAIVGTPMIVVYRVAPTTAFIFQTFVNYQGPIALANLVHVGLGSMERLVPELIQGHFTPENLCQQAEDLLSNQERWQSIRDRLSCTRSLLSGAGGSPSQNAAQAITAFMAG